MNMSEKELLLKLLISTEKNKILATLFNKNKREFLSNLISNISPERTSEYISKYLGYSLLTSKKSYKEVVKDAKNLLISDRNDLNDRALEAVSGGANLIFEKDKSLRGAVSSIQGAQIIEKDGKLYLKIVE